MSGDERGRQGSSDGPSGSSSTGDPLAGNPFLDEVEYRRAAKKRHKPPPGIISAGGVDMARGHASGIKPLEVSGRDDFPSQKVVVALPADPRRAPTNPRTRDGRPIQSAAALMAIVPTPRSGTPIPSSRAMQPRDSTPVPTRPALLPGSFEELQAKPRTPAFPPKSTTTLRVAAALALVVVAAGLFQRTRQVPTPILGGSAPQAELPPQTPREHIPSPVRMGATLPPSEPAAAAPTVVPADTAVEVAPPPAAETAAPRAPAPRAAAPKPQARRPQFKPPFELPGERSR